MSKKKIDVIKKNENNHSFCGIVYFVYQGSVNSIFACTDFRARKIVLRSRSGMQNYVCITLTVGANLYRLVYNLLIAIVFPTY